MDDMDITLPIKCSTVKKIYNVWNRIKSIIKYISEPLMGFIICLTLCTCIDMLVALMVYGIDAIVQYHNINQLALNDKNILYSSLVGSSIVLFIMGISIFGVKFRCIKDE